MSFKYTISCYQRSTDALFRGTCSLPFWVAKRECERRGTATQTPGWGEVSARKRHGIGTDLEQAYARKEKSRANRMNRRNAQTLIFRRFQTTSTLKIMKKGGGESLMFKHTSNRAPGAERGRRAVAWHEHEWLLSEKWFRGGQRRIGIVDQRKMRTNTTIQNKIIIIESTESSN